MKTKVLFLSVAIIIFWSSAFVGIQRVSSLIDPGSFAIYRLLISSFTLFIVAKVLRMKPIEKSDQLRVMLSGITGSTLYILFINLAQPFVTSTESCIIINTVPALTTLGGWLCFKQSVSKKAIFGLLVSFSGILFLALGKGELNLNQGIAFLLLAALSMASSVILQKDLLSRYSSLQVISIGLWWGTLAATPMAPGLISSIPDLELEAHLIILYLGVFPSALVYLAWGKLLKSTSTHRATSLLYVIPVVVALMGYLFLGEKLTAPVIIGGFLALGGVAIIQIPTTKIRVSLLTLFRRIT